MPLFNPSSTGAAGSPTLVSPDSTQTRVLKIDNTGRAYLDGNSVTERVLGSRVGSTTTVLASRVAGTLYQVDANRPARVTIMIALTCPLGASCSASLQIGDDAGSMVEQDREEVSYSGAISVVLGITPALTFQNGRTTKLVGDLSPGQWYRVVTAQTGQASVSIPSVKERVY